MIWGHVDGDLLTVEKPLARDPRDRKRMAIVSNGRQAKTDFFRLARFGPGDLLRAHLHTGRTHQIRVHLSAIGHPIVGDSVYGGVRRRVAGDLRAVLRLERPFLHAERLAFRHPRDQRRMEFSVPLPADLMGVLEDLPEWNDDE